MIPALIVPTLVHYDLLQRMLDSIDLEIEHVVIIDNGNSLNAATCSKAKKLSIIRVPTNLGVAASWNLGIKVTPFAKWWIIVNDDLIWRPGALEVFTQAIEEDVIVLESYSSDNSFSVFAIHESVISKVGLFDEFYYPGCGEEINYLKRIEKSDTRIKFIPHSVYGDKAKTREYFNNINKRATSQFFGNIEKALTVGTTVLGWQLEQRRISDLG